MDVNNKLTRNIEWKIHKKAIKHLFIRKSLSSNHFEIPFDKQITKWYLSAEIEDSQFGVYLYMQEPKTYGFSAKFEVFICTLNNEKEKNCQFEKDFSKKTFEGGWGWQKVISVSKLLKNSSKYFNNGILTIGARVELKKPVDMGPGKNSIKADSRHQAIFKDYFITKSLSDLTFVCSDGVKIKAHRFAIATASSVWKNMMELVPNIKIEVDDIDSVTMNEILRYIYTEKVNNIVNFAPKLIYGAQKYELIDLMEFCVDAMIKDLSVKNAVDYFLLAEQYNIEDLLDRSFNFIKMNLEVFVKDKSLGRLQKKHLITLLEHYQQNPEYVLILESSFPQN